MQQPSHRLIIITIVVVLVALYSFRNPAVKQIEDVDASVSLCQVHIQFDASDLFDDQILLSLLAALKMHDFQIGQPVWGPSDTLLYLCEHRLKTGLKQSTIDKKLNSVIKDGGAASKRIAWSCA